jgi:hypothetical protein
MTGARDPAVGVADLRRKVEPEDLLEPVAETLVAYYSRGEDVAAPVSLLGLPAPGDVHSTDLMRGVLMGGSGRAVAWGARARGP